MFLEDQDYQKLQLVAKERITDLQDDYHAKFEVILNELKHFVLKKHSEREDELSMFRNCLASAKKEVDDDCIKKIDEFSHYKKTVSKRNVYNKN
jgi:hypothetical protein